MYRKRQRGGNFKGKNINEANKMGVILLAKSKTLKLPKHFANICKALVNSWVYYQEKK